MTSIPNRRPGLARALGLTAAFLTALLLAARAQADAPDDVGLLAAIEGEAVPLPVLKTDVEVRLQGDLATVRVRQLFGNPHDEALHARYVFPLPSDAAVHAMTLVTGDRRIEAEIHPRPEARAIYQAAKERGNQAALLAQERPNVFTQEVANLTPGARVSVEIEYAHVVEKRHGHYAFHFPTVVGPRFLAPVPPGGDPGAPTAMPGDPEPLEIGRWRLPATPPVATGEAVDRERLGLRVRLEAGLPIRWLRSPSHAIRTEVVDAGTRIVTLAGGRSVDDQDFLLHYGLEGEAVGAGATTTSNEAGGFLSLLLEPPADARAEELTKRELVFVLDCSGSMSGVPIAASKRFMRRALPDLRAGDSFRIIRFSDGASEWSERPIPATPANVRRGLRYVDELYGSGGTVMTSGVRAALRPPLAADTLRIVVFLTDGYIGNDVEVVRLVQRERGQARFFSFGIGRSVNRYLIREMARVGRGAARIVTPDEDADVAADELAARLAAPILTDVEIDWGSAPVHDVVPSAIPDLFLGQAVRVMARYDGAGRHRVDVKGRIAGRPVTLPLELELPARDEGPSGAALPILWARAQVEDRMTSYLDPGRDRDEREALQEEVTRLGLAHRLVTQWTSFVAVARPVVNPGGVARDADVAVPRVKDVSENAYPPGAIPPPSPQGTFAGAAGSGFHGSSAPEPATWLAAAVLALLAVLSLRGRRADGRSAQ